MNKAVSKSKAKKKQASQSATPQERARQKLLSAARHLFAIKGLSGTSIRDIATKARLNSSMISYYFNGKEGLYKECLKEIGRAQLDMAEQLLKPVHSKEELKVRLQLFIDKIFALFLEDLDAGLIIVREYDRIHSPAKEIFNQTLLQVFDKLCQFFRDAQKKSVISKNKDSFVLTNIFFGALINMMRTDHVKESNYGPSRSIKSARYRGKVREHLIELILA